VSKPAANKNAVKQPPKAAPARRPGRGQDQAERQGQIRRGALGRRPLSGPELGLVARSLQRVGPPGQLVQHVLGILIEEVEVAELSCLP